MSTSNFRRFMRDAQAWVDRAHLLRSRARALPFDDQEALLRKVSACMTLAADARRRARGPS